MASKGSRRQRCSATCRDGSPCQKWAMPGVDICASHLGRTGRYLTMDPEVVERLERLIAAGNYQVTACRAAGISVATFKDWMRRGVDDPDERYGEFRERMLRARARSEARMVTLIAQAAEQDWKAAAFMLEREFPARWARASQREDLDADLPIEPERPVEPTVLDELTALRQAKARTP